MRSILFGILATTAALVSATRNECVQDKVEDLVSRTFCGDNAEISKCLRAEVDLQRLAEIEQCFIAGGCSEADATVEAEWFAHECHEYEQSDIQWELRRRADSAATSDAASTAAPSSTDVTTTSDSAASSAASSAAAASTTATAASSTTSDSSTTSSTATTTSSATSATTTGTLLCSTTNTKSISVCSVSAGKTLGCTPTVTAIGTCAAGNLCTTNTAGDPICMKKDDHLTTSGVVVLIVFATGIVGLSIGFIVVNVLSRRNVRRAELQRAALVSGGRNGKGKATNDVEAVRVYSQAQRARSEANIPLITPGGPRSDQQQYNQQDYFGHTPRGSNNASPNEPGRGMPPVPQIQLHQGLGALGQNNYR